MANTNDLKPIATIKPFTKFCCTIGAIPSSYLVSLTYEEQLLWLCDYLQNTLIPAINQNGEAITELQNLYIQLKEYVDNYFENLDVQEEINNKLDDMAEHGELQAIIEAYLQLNSLVSFDNITDLKNATNLINGSFAKTFGYTNINDGGGAYYKIVNSITETPDDLNIIELQNDLYAILIKEKYDIVFDSLQDLLDCEYLVAGTKCKTLGFYEKNDGGEAYYIIREITNQDETNNYSLIALNNSNTLVAELFTNNNEEIRITQLGIENNNNTILKYAITNFKNVIIDATLHLTDTLTIENTDAVSNVYGIGGILWCSKTGIIVSKNHFTIKDLTIRYEGDTTERITYKYSAIDLRASWLIIDNITDASFYYGISMTEENMVLFTKIMNCTLSYNIHSGIYLKALSTAQKNSLIFERNYVNKNGVNADDTSADGNTDDTGYGIYISGGLGIKCDSNVYEYNGNVGLYIEGGYQLNSFTDLNGYYEQNKRAQIFVDLINCYHVHIFNHSNNRPLANVSNAYVRTDVMFNTNTLNSLYSNDNIILPYNNYMDIFKNGNLTPLNNIEALKNEHINDCLSNKIFNSNNKLYLSSWANYQYIFPIVKNSVYKLRIKFADNVSNPNFGLFPYANFSNAIIPSTTHSLSAGQLFETSFLSDYNTNAMFYQNGTNTYEIEYISLIKVA